MMKRIKDNNNLKQLDVTFHGKMTSESNTSTNIAEQRESY